MFDDNANDKDNDDYFDNNVEANVEEYMLVNTNAMVWMKKKKGNQVMMKVIKKMDSSQEYHNFI